MNQYQLSEAPAEPVPVPLFSQFLGTLYKAEDGRLYKFRILEVHHRKFEKGSRHEYVVLVCTSEDGEKLYLCLERGPGDNLECEGKYKLVLPSDRYLTCFFQSINPRDPFPSTLH